MPACRIVKDEQRSSDVYVNWAAAAAAAADNYYYGSGGGGDDDDCDGCGMLM